MEIGATSKPHEIFDEWMTLAKSAGNIREPTAITLSTVNTEGEIHSRVLLCKHWSSDGFVVYTNYHSMKGHDLAQNPHAAGLFYWDPLFRQVKISGKVEKTSRADSESYWRTRPRASQLSQFISRQSETVASRDELEQLWQEAEARFSGREIPCPEHWGGYLLKPQRIEFWIGRPNRLHDVYLFEKASRDWTFRRLCP